MPLPQEFDYATTTALTKSRRSGAFLALALVAGSLLAATAWLALPLLRDRDDEYPVLERRADGVVVELLSPLDPNPRPGVTTVPVELLSYPYAYPPSNSGEGSCRDPQFTIEKMPPDGHVYRDDEALLVPIRYSAPGRSHAVVAYLGRHVEGSRRYELQCEVRLVEDCKDLRSWFFTDATELTSSEGTIFLPAKPVDAQSVTADSIPNLGGFVLCGIVVSVGDLSENGNHSSQEIRLGCAYDERGPLDR